MKGVTYLGSLFSCVVGREEHRKKNITGMCGECLQYIDHSGSAPVHGGVCFPGTHCSGSSILFGALSKAGPEFCSLPRSKPLAFRFLGTRKGTDLVRHAFCAHARSKQLRRPGACQHTVPGRLCILITSPVLAAQFPSVTGEHQLRCAVCLFWELFSDCEPPGRRQPARIPGRRG